MALEATLTQARAGLVALVGMTAIGGSQAKSAAPKDKVDMLHGATVDGATPGPIPGAFPVLDRADEVIATKVRTRARPGHPHTLRYAIFNATENRSDGACGDDDVRTPEARRGPGHG